MASFKNVDEESLLKIPGVVYVPLVGKVTVAMLERNLMRLYEQFHSPLHALKEQDAKAEYTAQNLAALQVQSSWGLRLQAYSAALLTLVVAIQLLRK